MDEVVQPTCDRHLLHHILVQYYDRHTPSMRNYDRLTTIHAGVTRSSFAQIRQILHDEKWSAWFAGLSVPLLDAARLNDLRTAEKLLHMGVRTGNLTVDGVALLDYLCGWNRLPMMRLFLRYAPHLLDFLPQDLKHGLVIIAVKSNHIQIVDFLVRECNVSVRGFDRNGHNAMVDAVKLGHLQIANLLLPYSEDINRVYFGKTLLHFSVALAHRAQLCPGMIRMLLQRGADPEIVDNMGDTAMRLAVAYKSLDSLNALLDAGANINSVNRNGDTPLHMAVGHEYCDVSRLLCARGADKSIVNNSGETARDIAVKWKLTAMLHFL